MSSVFAFKSISLTLHIQARTWHDVQYSRLRVIGRFMYQVKGLCTDLKGSFTDLKGSCSRSRSWTTLQP